MFLVSSMFASVELRVPATGSDSPVRTDRSSLRSEEVAMKRRSAGSLLPREMQT